MKKMIQWLLLGMLPLALAAPLQAQVAFKQQPPMLIGKQSADQIAESGRYAWFSNGMERYSPEKEVVNELKQAWSPGLQVLAFAGSWCPDTHRELPRFFKIAEEAGIPAEEVNLIFLDRKFNSGTRLEEKYDIKAVPTFVVLRSGKEIGRITESTEQPLEEELLRIVKQ